MAVYGTVTLHGSKYWWTVYEQDHHRVCDALLIENTLLKPTTAHGIAFHWLHSLQAPHKQQQESVKLPHMHLLVYVHALPGQYQLVRLYVCTAVAGHCCLVILI